MPHEHGEQPTPRTQLTQPKEAEPVKIPIPKEEDLEKLVRRAVKGQPEVRNDRS
jgi:hypothetical protein